MERRFWFCVCIAGLTALMVGSVEPHWLDSSLIGLATSVCYILGKREGRKESYLLTKEWNDAIRAALDARLRNSHEPIRGRVVDI